MPRLWGLIAALLLASSALGEKAPDRPKELWPWAKTVNRPKDRPQCVTDMCREFQRAAEKSMDTKADPCEDWHQYTCGNFASIDLKVWKMASDRAVVTWPTRFRDEIQKKYITEITGYPANHHHDYKWDDKDPPGVDHVLFNRMQKYWNDCVNEDKWVEFGLKVFQPVLDDIHNSFKRYNVPPVEKEGKKGKNGKKNKRIGEDIHGQIIRKPGWRLDPTQHIDVFDIEMMRNATLVLSQYGISAFAHIAPNRSLFDVNKMRVQIRPQVPDGLPSYDVYGNKGYAKHYRWIMKLWLKDTFPKGQKVNMKKLAQGLFDFEIKLHKIAPGLQELQDFKNFKSVTLDELRNMIPELSMDEVIAHQPEVTPDLIDKVEIQSPEYWERLSALLRDTPRNTIRAYFSWRFFLATWYLLENSHASIEYYNLSRDMAHTKTTMDPLDQCRDRMAHHFGPIVEGIYLNFSSTPAAVEMGREIAEAVRIQYSKEFDATPWMDEQTRANFQAKLANLTYDVAIPAKHPSILDQAKMTEYFKSATIHAEHGKVDKSHAMDYLNLEKWKMKQLWVTDLRNSPGASVWEQPTYELGGSYDFAYNRVALTAGLFEGFWHEKNLPLYILFSVFGVQAARETAHAFGISGHQISADGTANSMLATPQAVEGFNERAQCFINKYDGMQVENGQGKKFELDGDRVLNQAMADSIGLDVAFYAWQQSQVDRQQVDPFLWKLVRRSNEEMFFIMRSMWFCSKERDKFMGGRIPFDDHLPLRTKVWAPVRNSKAWHETFNCKPKEPICRLFNETVF